VTQIRFENADFAQTLERQGSEDTRQFVRGTETFAPGHSQIGVRLNTFFSRFLANHDAGNAVSRGMRRDPHTPHIARTTHLEDGATPMNTNTLKISVLAAALCAFAAPSAQAKDDAPAAAAHMVSASFETARPCAPQELVDRGWEQQFDLLEARLESKETALRVPGAIITSPFVEGDRARTGSKAKTHKFPARATSNRW
jgi:hypothetical protein